MINLLINAVKYTQKGTITLNITKSNQEPNSVLFKISDTGIGMSREKKHDFFESFTNESSSSLLEQKTDKRIFFNNFC